jgi:hypothetical protein
MADSLPGGPVAGRPMAVQEDAGAPMEAPTVGLLHYGGGHYEPARVLVGPSWDWCTFVWALQARWAWLGPFGTGMHVVASDRVPPLMVEVVPSRMTAVLLALCQAVPFASILQDS